MYVAFSCLLSVVYLVPIIAATRLSVAGSGTLWFQGLWFHNDDDNDDDDDDDDETLFGTFGFSGGTIVSGSYNTVNGRSVTLFNTLEVEVYVDNWFDIAIWVSLSAIVTGTRNNIREAFVTYS